MTAAVDLASPCATMPPLHPMPPVRGRDPDVFGAGPSDADLMLVGERPGDQEDRQGAPFVGPAGGVLDDAMR